MAYQTIVKLAQKITNYEPVNLPAMSMKNFEILMKEIKKN